MKEGCASIARLAWFGLALTAGGLLGAPAEIPGAPPPRVEKVDPPNWWAGHTINPVRLLVRGSGFKGASVTSDAAGLVPSGVRVNDSGTYLFVSVTIAPGIPPGSYPLALETAGGRAQIPFRIAPALETAGNFQGVTSDDVIYLIMTDRFADGEPSNDLPPGAPAASTDRENPRAYHGGDFRGIIDRLPYLKELGVTALWLTPWYQNWNGVEAGGTPSTYYHGYHAVDYYGVEDRFGDLATLRELVEKAHAAGLKIIQDQVANHVGSHHPWLKNPPLADWFHPRRILQKPIRTEILHSPQATPAQISEIVDGWFTARLPDLNQEEPEVARYEIQNALWWVGVAGIDGIRQDTLQFLPRPFIRGLCAALHRQYPNLRMIGEVTGHDPAHTAFFIGGHRGWDGIDTHLDSVFDFPLRETSCDVFTGERPVAALHDLLERDVLYPDASRLTTLMGNHDQPRFLSLENATLNGAMLEEAFILAVRGTPQLYYGDEIALAGGKDDDANRADFPGGFPGDSRNAFEPAGRPGDAGRMYEWTRDWLRLRREHPALRRGAQIDLKWDDDSYVFARREGSDLVVLAINRAASARELAAPSAALGLPPGAILRPLFGAGASARVSGGMITVNVPAAAIVPFGAN